MWGMAKRQRAAVREAVETPADPPNALSALQERIQYQFRNESLLQLALTHSSLAFERGGDGGRGEPNLTSEDNEQLEFLGDSVVGLIVTELLCKHFPERREGDLTRMRALLVSGKRMSEAGVRLQLGSALLLGQGEESSGGRQKTGLLADAVEALVAAIYLDAGTAWLKAARSLVEREIFQPHLEELRVAAEQGARFGGLVGDWKSALQELLQARAEGQPQYRTAEESGNDHNKRFRVEVLLREQVLATGEGTSKKAAQQAAAQVAYESLAPGPSAAATAL